MRRHITTYVMEFAVCADDNVAVNLSNYRRVSRRYAGDFDISFDDFLLDLCPFDVGKWDKCYT